MQVRLLPCGETATLIEVADGAAVSAVVAALVGGGDAATPAAGIVEVVPAARTVLVRYAQAATMA
ncbi:MAG: carboxyltransferase domain-containing protein, partial [Propionicimonas sp.]